MPTSASFSTSGRPISLRSSDLEAHLIARRRPEIGHVVDKAQRAASPYSGGQQLIREMQGWCSIKPRRRTAITGEVSVGGATIKT